MISNNRAVGVDFTLDELALFMGEANTIRVFQRSMVLKKLPREKTDRPINILILNRDRVSKGFLSWFLLYSQVRDRDRSRNKRLRTGDY